MHIVWFLPSTEGPRLDPGPKGSGHLESLAKLPSSCLYEKKDGAFELLLFFHSHSSL